MSSKPREMVEGREAFNRFRNALKAALSVPKENLTPRTKPKAKKKAR